MDYRDKHTPKSGRYSRRIRTFICVPIIYCLVAPLILSGCTLFNNSSSYVPPRLPRLRQHNLTYLSAIAQAESHFNIIGISSLMTYLPPSNNPASSQASASTSGPSSRLVFAIAGGPGLLTYTHVVDTLSDGSDQHVVSLPHSCLWDFALDSAHQSLLCAVPNGVWVASLRNAFRPHQIVPFPQQTVTDYGGVTWNPASEQLAVTVTTANACAIMLYAPSSSNTGATSHSTGIPPTGIPPLTLRAILKFPKMSLSNPDVSGSFARCQFTSPRWSPDGSALFVAITNPLPPNAPTDTLVTETVERLPLAALLAPTNAQIASRGANAPVIAITTQAQAEVVAANSTPFAVLSGVTTGATPTDSTDSTQHLALVYVASSGNRIDETDLTTQHTLHVFALPLQGSTPKTPEATLLPPRTHICDLTAQSLSSSAASQQQQQAFFTTCLGGGDVISPEDAYSYDFAMIG